MRLYTEEVPPPRPPSRAARTSTRSRRFPARPWKRTRLRPHSGLRTLDCSGTAPERRCCATPVRPPGSGAAAVQPGISTRPLGTAIWLPSPPGGCRLRRAQGPGMTIRSSSSGPPRSLLRLTRNCVVTTNSLRPPSGWSKKRTVRVSRPRVESTVRGIP